MAVKKFIQVNGNKTPQILMTKCEKIADKDVKSKEVQQIIQDLKDTAQANAEKCAGLAAPQIGYNAQIFLANKFEYDKEGQQTLKEYIVINPKIKETSNKKSVWWEGCLSIPDTWGLVERAKKIQLDALNEKGEKIKIKASGDFARLIQHETDHVNGILFTSKIIGKTMTENELDYHLQQSI